MKRIKAISPFEIIEEINKDVEEFAKLSKKEQDRQIEEQQKALKKYYENGGAPLTGVIIGESK